MKSSPTIGSLAKALVASQGEFRSVPKDSTNPHFKSKYASLEAVTEYARPILAKNGLAIVQGGDTDTPSGIIVSTTLVHVSGEWISNEYFIPLEKVTAQGAGSAISYGRRYGLSSILALTTDDDDDGHTASQPKRAAAPKADTKPANTPAPSGAPIMRIGKRKGEPLKNFTDSDLEGAVKWCKENKKFGEAVIEMEAELDSRSPINS